jgi:hypothetical protein
MACVVYWSPLATERDQSITVLCQSVTLLLVHTRHVECNIQDDSCLNRGDAPLP